MAEGEVDPQTALTQIKAFIAERGYPPTTRELTAILGLSSTRKTHELLVSLRAEGKIEWDERLARTLRVIGDGNRRTRKQQRGGVRK